MRPRWFADVLLGARIGLATGQEGWVRTTLTAIGVGLGVLLMLLAVSVPAMMEAREARSSARDLPTQQAARPAEDTLLARAAGIRFRDGVIFGMEVQPEGNAPPLPPGLDALPGPGEIVVSPALADLLASPDGALIKPRLDYPVVGTIGPDGLTGPAELAYYLGSDTLDDTIASRIDHFGNAGHGVPFQPLLVVLIVIGFVVLLLPVAIFVAVAGRFGGEQRDRRLAAVRLVGADQWMARRIAAGEALVGGVGGAVAGGVLFLAGRPFVEQVTVWGVDVFSSDVRPHPVLAGLVLLAAPAMTVAVTALALRQLMVEPFGVVRRVPSCRRRLWWRPLAPVLGLVLLWPLRDGPLDLRAVEQVQLAAGVILLLIGVVTLLPWLVEAVVRRLGGGPVAWQLATRRLQLGGGTAARVVSGVAVAVAGGIALQMLFSGVEKDFVSRTGADPDRPRAVVAMPAGSASISATELADRLAATTGVQAVSEVTLTFLKDGTADGEGFHTVPVAIGDCHALRALAHVGDCREGGVFLVTDEGQLGLAPGQRLPTMTSEGEGPEWTIPATADDASARAPLGPFHVGIAATPAAVAGWDYEPWELLFYLDLDPAIRDAVEHVRNTLVEVQDQVYLGIEQTTVTDEQFDAVRRALLAGITVTLLLIGLSLLVSTLEQLRERRRALAVLAAFGTRRWTLGASVLWQTAVPVVLGLALATLAGTAIGALLLVIVDRRPAVDWANVLAVSSVGAGMVLLTTALSLPALWRLMRAEGLRTE